MYLEISNRRTGKTSRLVSQIQNEKEHYKIQILMGINKDSLHYIKKFYLPKNNNVHICLSLDAVKKIFEKFAITDKSTNIRLYVDEFLFSTAFCNQFNEFLKRYPNIIKNGYYSSTINSNNNLILNSLCEIADNGVIQVIKYPNGFNLFL